MEGRTAVKTKEAWNGLYTMLASPLLLLLLLVVVMPFRHHTG
jgi:hypothetical protein